MDKQHWMVCDHASMHGGKSFCLYSEYAASKLKSDPARCVKHGSILGWADHATIGKDRAEARKILEGRKQEDY